MADENPPAPSESGDDITKSETIRITLPPKSEPPAVKRETVRINVPGKPTMPPAGIAPKKETTKLPSGSEEATSPGAPASPAGVSKPFIPPPQVANPLPSSPMSAPRPLGGAAPPPKPPTLGARPPVPLKPAVPVAPAGSPEPVIQRGAVPKKETARITIPTEGAKPALPKATVKMQQTQPLA